jgi:hypothetical protein
MAVWRRSRCQANMTGTPQGGQLTQTEVCYSVILSFLPDDVKEKITAEREQHLVHARVKAAVPSSASRSQDVTL